MRKIKDAIKNVKGVTLIALVVTIIVLLILAATTVGLIMNSDVIKQSKETVNNQTEYEQEEVEKLKTIVNGTKIVKDEGQVVAIEELATAEGRAWSNNQVTVYANTSKEIPEPGYELYMKIDKPGESWKKATEITVNEEDVTVSACLAKSVDNANTEHRDMVTMKVEGVDKTAPTQTAPTGTSTTKSITVKCNQEDAKSGIDTIQYILYSADGSTVIETSDWEKGKEHTFNNKTHNTKYKIATKAKDKAGNESESSKVEISTKELIAGTLTLKEENENGAEYTQGDITKNNVFVILNQGNEGTSTYVSEEGSAQAVAETKENTLITEEGITKLKVKTTDGFNTVERKYEITIQKIVPEVELRKGNSTGAEYESGTWTNEDVYHKITIDQSAGVTVQKYQYTIDNGKTWNDINGNLVETNVDYESTFPLSDSGKPDWFGDLTPNGTYYFDVDGTSLTSAGEHGNKGINNQTVNSYIPIDLRDFEADKELKITINYTISSENNYDFGYATITENTTAPDYNSSTGQFIKVSGPTATSEKSVTINGGKLYYLHLGYRKDTSQHTNDDTFKINSIKLEADDLGRWNFAEYTKTGNTVTYKLVDNMEKTFKIRAVYSNPSGKMSGASDPFTIKIDKMKPIVTGVANLTSPTKAEIVANLKRRGSPIKGYYISTNNTAPTTSSTWAAASDGENTIPNLNHNTTYYLWAIDEAKNISDVLEIKIGTANYSIDDSKYTDTLALAIAEASDGSTIKLLKDYEDLSTVAFNKDVTFSVGTKTLTRNATLTINSGKKVTITGETNGKIVINNANVSNITNNGELTISGSVTIDNKTVTTGNTMYNAILNNTTLNINGGTIIGYSRAIMNNNTNSTTNISNGTIKAEGAATTYGIYNNGKNAIINVTGGTINTVSESGNTYGIYCTTTGQVNVEGGMIQAKTSATLQNNVASGIYNNSTGTVYVKGGFVQGSTTHNIARAYGVYSATTDTVTIGDVEEEVNTTQPVVLGTTYGIFLKDSSYNFYFNNKMIQSDSEYTYNSRITPREGYMPYTYYDDGINISCTILVEKVDSIQITHTPTEWTNQNVAVRIVYPFENDTILQYSENGTNWIRTREQIKQIAITENKTIYARILNTEGTVIEQAQHTISNIDKIKPTATVTPSTTRFEVLEQNSKVNIPYTITATDQGGSQIKTKKYGWSSSRTEEPSEWTEIQNGVQQTKSNTPVGTYYLWMKVEDNAGNKSDINVLKYMVIFKEPVAQIGTTKYESIREAIEAAVTLYNSGTRDIQIDILKDTDEAFTVPAGLEVTVNINGNTLGTSVLENPTVTNNGTLSIIDTNFAHPGTIEHITGTAIKNNGTLKLGKDDEDIGQKVPQIYGKDIGIDTDGHEFYFYDGTITGKTPIYKEATAIPENFEIIGEENEGLTKVYLAVVIRYVARIDYVFYTTLQDAIDDCEVKENNTTPTEIVILKDIVLDETANVKRNQNIIIDLNDHTIATNTTNTAIDNRGDLCITDKSEGKRGNINITIENDVAYAVYNSGVDKLRIEGGTLNCSNYGVFNNRGATIEVAGGTIFSNNYNNQNSYGIFNNGSGIVRVESGTIASTSSSNSKDSYSYGIYNNGEGTVEILNGEINSTSDSMINSYSYGIYNNSNGLINIKNGIVKSKSNESDNMNHNYYARSYGIYNNNNSNTKIEGGKILVSSTRTVESSTYSLSYGVYNNNFSELNIVDGEIDLSNDKRYLTCYGVYNDKSTVNMYGGKIKGTYNKDYDTCYGIYNRGSTANESTVTIENGTIEISAFDWYDNCYGVYNESNSILKYNGGHIIINSEPRAKGYNSVYGIYNYSSYSGSITKVNIKGGEITTSNNGPNIGIYNSNYSKVVIGTKDNLINKENIKINTTDIGVANYRNSNVEFYDGTIIGVKDYIISGDINKIEDNSKIVEEDYDGNNYCVYLQAQNTTQNIVINENTGTQYTNLQKAISEANDNEETTIRVLRAFSTSENIEIYENKNIILNLNGYAIDNKYFKTINNGILTINDTTGGGQISEQGMFNYGNLNVTGISIINQCGINGYAISNEENGTVEINNTSINSVSNRSSFGVNNVKDGNIRINNSSIDSQSYSVINGGDSASAYGAYNNSSGTITILGNTTIYSYSQFNNTHWSFGIYNYADGKVEFKNGQITGRGYGIYNNNSGLIEFDAGEINTTNTGICNYRSGQVDILGGKIENTYQSCIDNKETGIINIGIKGDGIVSTEEPNITAHSSSYYGVYNTKGTFNFYDGIIKGDNLSIYSSITEWEENTELSDDITIAKEIYLVTDISNAAKIGNTEYVTLQEAINACSNSAGNTQTTIELLKSISLSKNTDIVTVSQGKNIKLDMHGYSIVSGREDVGIENSGKLVITNETDNIGKINGTPACLIKNNQTGTLTLGKVNIEINSGGSTGNYNKAITNEGSILVTDSTITVKDIYNYPIYNTGTGTVKFEGGSIINRTSHWGPALYAIYNVGLGTVEMTGGTIDINGAVPYGIYNVTTGNVILNGGTITVRGSNGSGGTNGIACGIYNNGDGNITMISGDIHSTGEFYTSGSNNYSTSYGIYNEGEGTINMYGGHISSYSKNRVNEYKNSCYGIYNLGTQTITLGRKADGTIAQDNPTITATVDDSSACYGIYNPSSTINMYDGTVESKKEAIAGRIYEIDNNAELLVTDITKVQVQQVNGRAVQINSTTYNTLQEAVNSCQDNTQTTIKITRDTTQPGALIGANKNIILDLNGHSMTVYNSIENNGTFKLIDSSGTNAGRLINIQGTAIEGAENATTEIASGTISGATYGVKGTANITGGVITNNTYGAYGNITASGATISNNSYGIYNTGTTNITGVTFDSNENGIYSYTGTTNLRSSTFNNNNIGMSIGGGTANIISGTVAGNVYGISTTRGYVNIGTQDGVVTRADPIIVGEEYGINTSIDSIVALYDGTIKGKTGSVLGYISIREVDYVTFDDMDGDYYCTFTVPSGSVSTVAKIGNIEFTSLYAAINSCEDNVETTIKIVNGTVLKGTVNVPSGKKIILDINGCSIKTTTLDTLIKNHGELTIIDTNGDNTGTLENSRGVAVENLGKLTLGQNDGTINTKIPYLIGGTYGITNSGTFNFYDGVIQGTVAPVNGSITSRPNGTTIKQINNSGNIQYILN